MNFHFKYFYYWDGGGAPEHTNKLMHAHMHVRTLAKIYIFSVLTAKIWKKLCEQRLHICMMWPFKEIIYGKNGKKYYS